MTFRSQLLKVVTLKIVRLANSPRRLAENFTIMYNPTFTRVNMSWPSLKIGSSLNDDCKNFVIWIRKPVTAKYVEDSGFLGCDMLLVGSFRFLES